MKTGLSAVLHFLVDGLCLCGLYLMTAQAGADDLVGVFIAYNVLAFLTQPFSGLLADSLCHPHWQLLSAVVILLLAALSVTVASPVIGTPWLYLAALLFGTGNSLFHTWGGKQTAVATGNDIRALGVFVSTGAFGLAVSTVCCSWTLFTVLMMGIAMLSLAYLIIDQDNVQPRHAPSSPTFGGTFVSVCLLALMLAVMLRSFVGESFTGGIAKEHAGTVLLIGFIAMAGKMAGGWIARRLGVVSSLTVLVVLVVGCLLLRACGLPVLLGGLFLVNCTMPITLYLANVVLPRREGLAFGLLAAALMPGYLLAML